jgi:glucose/arabinose dehydrogenase
VRHGRSITTALWLALIALTAAAPAAAAPPAPALPGYQDVAVVDAVESPMAVRFAPPPDGRIFVAEKSGVVLAFDAPHDPVPDVVVDLREEVYDFYDRGMLGMALDRDFALNRRMYLLYSRDAPIGGSPPAYGDDCEDATGDGCLSSGRLVRLTLPPFDGGTPTIEPLIEHEWCQQFPSHSIGTVAMGGDGMLYVGAGDGAMWWPADTGQLGDPAGRCDDPPGEGGSLRSQDVRTTGDPTGLDGAIVRIDPLTGEAAPGNPFTTGDANRRRIVAFGMRNPFRFAFRPGTRELWIGDVGNDLWEEVNRIDTADAEAENLGWPCYERADRPDAFASLALCRSLPQSAVTMPAFAYHHQHDLDGCGADGSTGSSISGIAFDAAGAMYVSDYARNCIWKVQPGAGGEPDFSTTRVFAKGAGGTGPVDLQIGPAGDVVYAYYDPYDTGNSAIRRIRSSAVNAAPVASLTADRTSGHAPLLVHFSGASSTDADGDELAFAWDLDGDGAYDDGTGMEIERTFADPVPVTVRLRVRDPLGEEDVAQVRVSPGNTPPQVAIDAPAPGTTWAVGDAIALAGSATDAEGDDLDLTWTLTLEHCVDGGGCHAHPMQQLTGAHATFTAPDHAYPAHVTVRLEASDPGGLSDTATLALYPRTVRVGVRSEPAGLTVGASGTTALEGSTVVLTTEREQGEYRFVRWSDGSTEPVHTVRVPADAEYAAEFARAPPLEATQPPGSGGAAARDLTPPRLRVLSARLRRGRVRVRAMCPDEACRLGVRARHRRAVRRLRAGRPVTVTLRVRARRRVTLQVSASDAAGNRTVRRRVARL